MIDIKNIDGSVLFSVIPDENAVFHEELMASDYVQLSWSSDEYTMIPAGAYIEYDGEKYKLLDNYSPTQQDEFTYKYTPKFQSHVMNWDKQITPVYTYEQDGTTVKSREMDWEFTGSPADAMYIVKQAIKNETGEEWTIQLAESLPATISISSQSSSIFATLNTIAGECDTEWWADKKTNTLYLSKCIFGDAVKLEVGDNVQVPTVTNDSEGYFTRFYAFGSTRNITQDYEGGGATNHIVNKRLTLNPTKYPNGYKDIKSGLKKEEVFVKVLYFDDIYPSSKLTISDVRARLKYRLDNNGQKIRIGGTDSEPIYEQYAIWYFQIQGFTFNPSTDVIEGLNLSASFESGQLAGRDFELTYHEKASTVNDAADVTAFNIKAGDYEIVIDESSGTIIPGTSYIIPQNGDSLVLYNITMPDEYVSTAQDELEKALDKAMLSYTEDNKSYQMASDPTRFYENSTDIKMGQSVTFVNGGKSLYTRVQMVEKRLDLSCYQTIKVGNKIIKGNTKQLKDEVASVNQNLDVIKAFNELSSSLSQAYANAQREMIEGFAAIKNLWTLETDEHGNKYAYTKYDIFGKGGITAFTSKAQVPSIFDGLPLDNVTIWKNPGTGLIEVIGGAGGGGEAESVDWANITDKPKWITTEKPQYSYTEITGLTEELEKYVTLTTDQSISGMKDFSNGMKVSGILFKVIDGVLTLDCSIAVTGGITAYALGEQTASSIMDAIICDNTTIAVVDGRLTVIGGTGGASNWDELEGKPLWITDTKPTYAWGEITQKPTTLSGYGIQASDVLNVLKTVDGSWSGLDADTLDGIHATGLLTSMSSSRGTNLSVTVGGTTKKISSLHADYAYSLYNSVQLWGNTFDGTQDLSGTISISGTNQLLFSSYGGGFYMNDSSYLRVYNNKILRSDSGFSSGEYSDDKYAPFCCTRGNGRGSFCCYAMIRYLTKPFGIGYDSSNRVVLGSANTDRSMNTWIAIGIDTTTVNGNILATGGITCYTSDERAKTIIEDISLSLKDIAESPTIRFKWNGWNIPDDGKTHIGGIAQYVRDLLPETVLEADGALHMDYATVGYVFSVQTARHLQSYETKTDREIRKLKKRIVYLESKLKKLGYEEADIMVD